VHVDLSSQTLVAYEGDRAVFATLVSSGREGFETPTGTIRIQSKHVSATMDDTASATEAYSIEDVPWTMYFEGSFALHAALWHDQFGRPRSHGCVNLAPADARWLFQWTGPVLPPGWHGVVASSRRQGSWVHITE
jgi:lipoprotein-anchoring transpeptidase ErfK/SrfK